MHLLRAIQSSEMNQRIKLDAFQVRYVWMNVISIIVFIVITFDNIILKKDTVRKPVFTTMP